jgi:hypothetical protein
MKKQKKHFQRTKKHSSNQYAMSKTSYKPNNQKASNNVHIVQFTPEQQQHKTPDQLYLHLCDFMMEGIETMTKTANKKKKKTSNCSTVQMKRLHVLLNLPIKHMGKTFQILSKCKHICKNKLRVKKKTWQ